MSGKYWWLKLILIYLFHCSKSNRGVFVAFSKVVMVWGATWCKFDIHSTHNLPPEQDSNYGLFCSDMLLLISLVLNSSRCLIVWILFSSHSIGYWLNRFISFCYYSEFICISICDKIREATFIPLYIQTIIHAVVFWKVYSNDKKFY